MTDSILDSTKEALGLAPDYDVFDAQVIMHINTVFATLNDLGIGPTLGFEIEDNTALWSTYQDGDIPLNRVRTYMYLKVRMLFDPPTTSYLLNAYEKQIAEIEWRLHAARENKEWVSPLPLDPGDEEYIIDGGVI